MAGDEATGTPFTGARRAAERRSKRRMSEHMDVRVRRSAIRRNDSRTLEVRSHRVGLRFAQPNLRFPQNESSSLAMAASETRPYGRL